MARESKRVNAIIDMRLYDDVMKLGFTISEAITIGLEKLLELQREEITNSQIGNVVPEVLETKDKLIQALQIQIEDLKEQLKTKDNSYYERIKDLKDQLKVKDENQLSRITDFKEEITLLCDQLKEKDTQIKNLTTITESQVKGYKLIEAPGQKRKPWYKFW